MSTLKNKNHTTVPKRNICNFFLLCEDILVRKKFAELFGLAEHTPQIHTAIVDSLEDLQSSINETIGTLAKSSEKESTTQIPTDMFIFVDFHARSFVPAEAIQSVHDSFFERVSNTIDNKLTIIGIAQAMYPEMLRQGKLSGMTQLLTKPLSYELVEKMIRIAQGESVNLEEKGEDPRQTFFERVSS